MYNGILDKLSGACDGAVVATDDERLERILENDLMLKHDSIWPHGLNTRLHMDSLVELAEFRRSCLRHGWPPDHDAAATSAQLDLDAVRRQLAVSTDLPPPATTNDQRVPADQKKNTADTRLDHQTSP